jgi:hypothetical protein
MFCLLISKMPWHHATKLLRELQRSTIWLACARVRSERCVSTDLIRALASPISMRCSDRLHLRTSWSCPRRKLPAICKSSIAF